MEELAALIAALFNTFTKRDRPERPAGGLGRALRDAFAERVPLLGAPATAGSLSGRSGAPPPRPADPAIPSPAAPSAVGGTAATRRAPEPQRPEAGRVTALFASPQSLVAAFIVAEVLAKPVALRDEAASLNPHAEPSLQRPGSVNFI